MSEGRDGASGRGNDVAAGPGHRKDWREFPRLSTGKDLAGDARAAGRIVVRIMELDAGGLDMRMGVAPSHFEQWSYADHHLRHGNEQSCLAHQ